jgi:hypothetical protein
MHVDGNIMRSCACNPSTNKWSRHHMCKYATCMHLKLLSCWLSIMRNRFLAEWVDRGEALVISDFGICKHSTMQTIYMLILCTASLLIQSWIASIVTNQIQAVWIITHVKKTSWWPRAQQYQVVDSVRYYRVSNIVGFRCLKFKP